MYKLVFIILTLSGFLIYKAYTLKVTAKTGTKTKKNISVPYNNKPADKGVQHTSKTKPQLNMSEALESSPQGSQGLESERLQPSQPSSSMREDFDSLGDVFQQSEEVKEEQLTQQEREKHEQTVNLIKKIEAEAAAKSNLRKGTTKSPEDLTPEERKQFEFDNSTDVKEESQ